MKDFVHLHVHTEYSLLDGAIKIPDLLQRAKDYDMKAVAITDHGNMYGAIDFYKYAKKAGIKPIIGSEFYISKGSRFSKGKSSKFDETEETGMNHLLLLAQNSEGYKNLLKLTSKAFIEGFYYKPRVDMELLKEHSEGLIALSACLKGELPEAILEKGIEEGEKVLHKYLSIFNRDNFFIEIMDNSIKEQAEVNEKLIFLSQKYSIPLVATNDCHYLDKNMVESHDVLLCIQTGKTVNDINRLRFSGGDFYFKSKQEMINAFSHIPQAISNTTLIAEMCNVDIEFGKYQFPKIALVEGETLEEKFESKAIKGLKDRIPEIKRGYKVWTDAQETIYWDRLKIEIATIKKMGFSGYFLIVEDFINYAKKNNIPVGPGRGSAAGSLVAYALKITDINPIPYNLLFERFLNPERISMPDIDIDFCNRNRDKVINYVTEKYGREKVSQIVTFGKMNAKAVIRDVGRALNIPYKDVDRIAKMIPNTLGITLDKAIEEVKELQESIETDSNVKKIIEISKHLEGLSRHASVHAAGIVISNDNLYETTPLALMKEGKVVTQYNMKNLEDIGLIKFDFLGLKNLTVISNSVEMIKRTKVKDFDISNIPLDDRETYNLISSGKTIGIFQLESHGIRELIKRLKPDKFEDLIALVALYRPGPLGSGMVDEFIDVKHGRKAPNYALRELEPILKDTYGIILYQEQVMQISQILGGYSLGESDLLRRAMGKKIPEVMQQQKGRFLDGCKKNNFPLEISEEIFDKMAKFAEYGFNKSHSAAYAYVAYQTAYLKAHFKVEFMASLLTEDKSDPKKIIKDINECKSLGIEILPPDINESELDFTVVGDKIRFGLGAVKNVGEKAIESIIEGRKKQRYQSLPHFLKSVTLNKVNKKVVESLIKSGAMDSLPFNRSTKFNSLESIISKIANINKSNEQNFKGLFGNIINESIVDDNFPMNESEEWDEKTLLQNEKELLGFFVSSHPLNKYKRILEDYQNTTVDDIFSEDFKSSSVNIGGIVSKIKLLTTKKKGEKMASIILEDFSGEIEVVIFPKLFYEKEGLIKEDSLLFIQGDVDKDETNAKIIAKEIIHLSEVREKFTNKLTMVLYGIPKREVVEKLYNDLKDYLDENGKHFLSIKIKTDEGEVYINCPDFRLSDTDTIIRNVNSQNKEFDFILE